jgi:hypothetical protein
VGYDLILSGNKKPYASIDAEVGMTHFEKKMWDMPLPTIEMWHLPICGIMDETSGLKCVK